MQDMLNKDFDKLILRYGFSTVKECAKSFFKMVDPNDNTTTIGDVYKNAFDYAKSIIDGGYAG